MAAMTSPPPCLIDLPIELLITITGYLSPFDRINFSETCRLFQDVCCTKSVAKNLDLHHCYKLSESHLNRFTALQNQCLNIRVLNINGCYWLRSTMLVQCIARLKNLEELHLLECPIKTQLLKLLTGLHHLASLSFSASDNVMFYSQLSSWTALAESNLSGLKSLTIVTDAYVGLRVSLKYAVVCRKLESFELLLHNAHDFRLRDMVEDERPTLILPPSLKAIKVADYLQGPTIIPCYDMEILKMFCSSETLWDTIWIETSSFLRDWIQQGKLSVTQFANMKAVNLNDAISTLEREFPAVDNMIQDMFCLGQQMQCTELSMTHAYINPLLLRAIATSCPQLRTLNINSSILMGINEDEQKSFELLCETCTHITELRLHEVYIRNDAWTPLSNLRDIRKLSISISTSVSFHNIAVGHLMKRSSSDQRIGLQTLATDDQMKRSQIWILTENCKHVEYLEISSKSNGPVDEIDLFCISRWNKLSFLFLLNMQYVNHGNFLTTILRDCPRLQTLKIICVGAPADCIYLRPLAEGLRLAHKLKDLSLIHNHVNLSAQFLESMSHCTTLERLHIDKVSNLDDRVITSIVNAAHKLPNLIFVHMVVLGTIKDYNKLKQKLSKFKQQRPAFLCVLHKDRKDETLLKHCPMHHLQL